MSQTRDVDTLRQNAVVEQHKLTVLIFAPLLQRLKELITGNFGLIHICTMLRCDVQNIITTIAHLLDHVGGGQHPPQHTGARSGDKHLRSASSVHPIQNATDGLTVDLRGVVLGPDLRGDVRNDLRCHDAAIVDQLRSRNTENSVTKHVRIVHATIIRITRKLRSSSEKIGIVCTHASSSHTNKMTAISSIMGFIKISKVHINAAINDTPKRMISSENKFMNSSSFTYSVVTLNLLNFGSAVALYFTTVNMKNRDINFTIQFSKELLKQLNCQENTRSNDNNSFRRICIK